MKDKIVHILIGFVGGVVATVVGIELYLLLFTNYELFSDFSFINNIGLVGRITAIGSLLNLLLFTFFINRRLDFMARGCILAVIILTIITQLV
ncbi:hypothetical protein HX045_13840 [Myroides odoratimimus]|uniref:Uncharacterized protein n=3 Tax=Myroides odoratimimus TaxID=76832 RepID=A0A0U3GTI0_9FLAO|nr:MULTISPECIES: hypothetical protein [Myroides]AJA68704.1 hypothetical protein MYRA21_1551 [Myroides sp. A21]ALU25967.1 hypothetical protein AS202_07350 [Myroides odoratimimus]EHO11141.1 hypothetical protein HMPREF9712_00798 [Myroides odoratimimus CCUG 10230]EHO14218.1 hypothetical protein HMPREF9714_00480 [Myroides odoratimimus CCUG 12901]EHO14600.1 hypothetical protein HMPREF9715_00485 [Myroides odoratimimus CIP 101113]